MMIALLSTDSDTQQDGIISPPPPLPAADSEELVQSKNALTHNFEKLRGPSRCRECDTYVYFHGFECDVVRELGVIQKYNYRALAVCQSQCS